MKLCDVSIDLSRVYFLKKGHNFFYGYRVDKIYVPLKASFELLKVKDNLLSFRALKAIEIKSNVSYRRGTSLMKKVEDLKRDKRVNNKLNKSKRNQMRVKSKSNIMSAVNGLSL